MTDLRLPQSSTGSSHVLSRKILGILLLVLLTLSTMCLAQDRKKGLNLSLDDYAPHTAMRLFTDYCTNDTVQQYGNSRFGGILRKAVDCSLAVCRVTSLQSGTLFAIAKSGVFLIVFGESMTTIDADLSYLLPRDQKRTTDTMYTQAFWDYVRGADISSADNRVLFCFNSLEVRSFHQLSEVTDALYSEERRFDGCRSTKSAVPPAGIHRTWRIKEAFVIAPKNPGVKTILDLAQKAMFSYGINFKCAPPELKPLSRQDL